MIERKCGIVPHFLVPLFRAASKDEFLTESDESYMLLSGLSDGI